MYIDEYINAEKRQEYIGDFCLLTNCGISRHEIIIKIYSYLQSLNRR